MHQALVTSNSQHRVLTRIFGHKRDEVRAGWRKLHNEEFCSSYSLPNIISMRRVIGVGHVACIGSL
jgi:hypothetical protein